MMPCAEDPIVIYTIEQDMETGFRRQLFDIKIAKAGSRQKVVSALTLLSCVSPPCSENTQAHLASSVDL